MTPDEIDKWRDYARFADVPFPDPPTPAAIVQLARDLAMRALPSFIADATPAVPYPPPLEDLKAVARTMTPPTVSGDLRLVQLEIKTNRELRDGQWPRAKEWREQCPYCIALFLRMAEDESRRISPAAVEAARRLAGLRAVLSPTEVRDLVKEVA